MPLELESRVCGRVHVIECKGRIVGGEEAKALEAAILHDTRRDLSQLVIHLGEVTFLDSIGLGLLVRYATIFGKRNGGVRLVAPPPFVAKLLHMTRLTTVLPASSSSPATSAHSPLPSSLNVDTTSARLATPATPKFCSASASPTFFSSGPARLRSPETPLPLRSAASRPMPPSSALSPTSAPATPTKPPARCCSACFRPPIRSGPALAWAAEFLRLLRSVDGSRRLALESSSLKRGDIPNWEIRHGTLNPKSQHSS